MYKQGDILLISVPFTDLTSSKKRPVLVVSNDEFNYKSEDIIVAAITSNVNDNPYSVLIDSIDLDEGVLLKTSCVKIDKLYTLAQSIVLRKFGRLKSEKSRQVSSQIVNLIS